MNGACAQAPGPTLREFCKRYSHEMVPGCWYAILDTCGETPPNRACALARKRQGAPHRKTSYKNDIPEVLDCAKESDLWRDEWRLLENQVRNRILTHYSLRVIEHCASSQERSELFTTLRVKAAMIYPKSVCIEYTGPECVNQWIDAARLLAGAANGTGKLHTCRDLKSYGVTDNRIGPWLKSPFGTFMTPLLERRRSRSANRKQPPKHSAEWRRLNAAQCRSSKWSTHCTEH